MIRSLRLRLMLAATTLAVLFMLALLPAMQGAFSLALQDSIEKRLASDVTTLISAARIENNRLQMPAQLPDERFNLADSRLLGYIYDREGHLVWRSRATQEENINYRPRYDGRGNEFARIREANGQEFFVYDVEIKLLGARMPPSASWRCSRCASTSKPWKGCGRTSTWALASPTAHREAETAKAHRG